MSYFVPKSNHGAKAAQAEHMDVTLKVAFIELMELLEFSVLRLNSPDAVPSMLRQHELIGTLDWQFPELSELPEYREASSHDHSVYICSTTAALRDAVLPADDTDVRFESAVVSGRRGIAPQDARGIRLSATTRRESSSISQISCTKPAYLRVDLNKLLRGVVVPSRLPQQTFELVQSVVRSRVWVDVVRR